MADKRVYRFSKDLVEGDRDMKNTLGGKGANLHEMCKIGLNVPPGFTITTETCVHYFQNGNTWAPGLEAEVEEAVQWLEKTNGKKLGDTKNPLLVSVRSGARASMPGMMDTILNLGLNDTTVETLATATGNRRFAMDSYRRFIKMFGDVVLGIKGKKGEHDPFEEALESVKKKGGKKLDTELTAEELEEVVRLEKKVVFERTGRDFPVCPREQLRLAINAVFDSWMNARAIEYRRIYRIPEDWGTAVNVQTMVFGNMGNDCGTGVAFTRDAATGENVFYGEFLMNAQGEDVVAGIRTPLKIAEMAKVMPHAYDELVHIRTLLENHYRDMQDLEFTIEKGKLFILQCRSGKRTGLAAVNIAIDMLEEGMIDEETAITRIEAGQVMFLLRPIFNAKAVKEAAAEGRLVAKGLPAGPGAATGRVAFFSDEIKEQVAKWGDKAILVRIETSPEDIKGMETAEGILTQRGGMTSHAALVARQRGKVCVAGCSDIEVDYKNRLMKIDNHVVREGDWISIDGSTGSVYLGKMETAPSEVIQVLLDKTLDPKDAPNYRKFERLMAIADRFTRMSVRTNADNPLDASRAIEFGAKGIGLCRTEHMFFEGDRITSMRKMIMADNETDRRVALAELLPFQREDFYGIFKAMKGYPVTVRLLDPPLHEFLPGDEKSQKDFSAKTGIPVARILERIEELHEQNPMLGHRGCRLGNTYPEITEMQARAIFEAACDVAKEGLPVHPEVMVPLVGHVNELKVQADIIRTTAEKVFAEKGVKVEFLVGTMIEVPRATVTSAQIAEVAEFFSFGTNDLTQMGFGMSRDDYAKFMPIYIQNGILKHDPFATLDDGIFELLKLGVNGGRTTRPDLKCGICGEHGGDPDSIDLCDIAGLNYVSCSPFRVPVARVAAAQANIAHRK
ncbi:MAG TPA: pyruvate, phosphate dikinase [Myxococcota bacterium]|nr:pyruvate, phosphate dikinase [Myxococcota bacterium]HOD07750.1 pyruvate, phosphate dikinase [Myxococcota bacterium]HPB50604.1 pyruvate, phosphate dikinase [Myxococcota bacterium]HQP95086.1 pyruvate, phosphate dikinase [Myxococcota bacterium]